MIANHIEKLTSLYTNAELQVPYFKRNTYEQAFKKVYDANLSVYDELNSELEGKDEAFVKEYVNELASEFCSVFKSEYDEIPKKGKKNTYVTNHNTTLVVYVFPTILEYSAKWCKPCVEAIVDKWNDTFKEMHIGYTTYENIKAGFKTKLCYITTAVCESLGKDDDCQELNLLRSYRDEILVSEEGGKELIDEYYNIAPTIVKRINRSENSDVIYNDLYDKFIVKCINDIENENYEQCRQIYTEMVNELKNKYAY